MRRLLGCIVGVSLLLSGCRLLPGSRGKQFRAEQNPAAVYAQQMGTSQEEASRRIEHEMKNLRMGRVPARRAALQAKK